GHGDCSDSSGLAACTCVTGYVGDDCATCAEGYAPDGAACVELAPVITTSVSLPAIVTTQGAALLTATVSGRSGAIAGLGAVESEVPISTGELLTTTDFTLTVTSLLGEQTTETITVSVVPPPSITSFDAA